MHISTSASAARLLYKPVSSSILLPSSLSTSISSATTTPPTTKIGASTAPNYSSSSSSTPSTTRSFSSTPASQITGLKRVANKYASVPPYPYGARTWYKKSNFGLYGSARVRFGNNVSAETETRTRRRWYPNVQNKRLWSVALGRMVRVKVVIRVLRSIEKAGGLDEYLLGETPGRLKDLGPGGWALRWRLMRSPAVQDRYRRQREELGLPEMGAGVGVQSMTATATAVDGYDVAQVPVEDVGMTEEQLREREAAIDRVLDEDAERDAKGMDGGVEIDSLLEEEEEKKRGSERVEGEGAAPKSRRRW